MPVEWKRTRIRTLPWQSHFPQHIHLTTSIDLWRRYVSKWTLHGVTAAEEGRLETLPIQTRDHICLGKYSQVFIKATQSALVLLCCVESKWQGQSPQRSRNFTSQGKPYSKKENLIIKTAITGNSHPHRIPNSFECVSSTGEETGRLVISRLPGVWHSHISLLKGKSEPIVFGRTWQLMVVSYLACAKSKCYFDCWRECCNNKSWAKTRTSFGTTSVPETTTLIHYTLRGNALCWQHRDTRAY